MRLCVLGNSHAAALKTGLALLVDEQRSALKVTFFASAGQTLGALEAREGLLMPVRSRVAGNLAHSSDGLSQIAPGDYDAFVLHGLAPGCCYELLTGAFYSAGLVEAFTIAAWQASLAARLHTELRRLTDKPVVVSPRPLLAEHATRQMRALHASPTPPADMARVLERLKGTWGPGTHFLPQPPQTVVQGVFTASAWSAGSTRLERPDHVAGQAHGPRDARHMNAAYGACVWQAVVAMLEGVNTAPLNTPAAVPAPRSPAPGTPAGPPASRATPVHTAA